MGTSLLGTTISQLLSAWGCSSVVCDYFFTTIVAVALFVMPVCMFRHFGHLAYISLFSIGAIGTEDYVRYFFWISELFLLHAIHNKLLR